MVSGDVDDLDFVDELVPAVVLAQLVFVASDHGAQEGQLSDDRGGLEGGHGPLVRFPELHLAEPAGSFRLGQGAGEGVFPLEVKTIGKSDAEPPADMGELPEGAFFSEGALVPIHRDAFGKAQLARFDCRVLGIDQSEKLDPFTRVEELAGHVIGDDPAEGITAEIVGSGLLDFAQFLQITRGGLLDAFVRNRRGRGEGGSLEGVEGPLLPESCGEISVEKDATIATVHREERGKIALWLDRDGGFGKRTGRGFDRDSVSLFAGTGNGFSGNGITPRSGRLQSLVNQSGELAHRGRAEEHSERQGNLEPLLET